MSESHDTAQKAEAAIRLCADEFSRKPRDIARHAAERRLLLQIAASIQKRSIEDIERALNDDEERTYDSGLQDLLKSHPAMAVFLDDRIARNS